MENFPYLFAAYSVIWAVLFGYLLALSDRQRQARREINSLKEQVKNRGKEKSPADETQNQ